MSNKFYFEINSPIKQGTEEYDIFVDLIHKFMVFEIKDIYKNLNRRLPKGKNVSREKVVSTLRVMIKNDLISYRLMDQKMVLNKTKTKKQ